MTRLRADCLLLMATAIWGTAFVAQKIGMNGLGPFDFAGLRFALSALVVLPFAWRESRKGPALSLKNLGWGLALALAFSSGVYLQQIGLVTTSVTNAGFLTSLYVIFVPLIAGFLTRQAINRLIWPACGLAILGAALLNQGSVSSFKTGDWLVIGCAFSFAMQMILAGYLVTRTKRPLGFAFFQYLICATIGLSFGSGLENFHFHDVITNLWPLLYAGLVSGGVAFTLQMISQQYTPTSDAAIIMASESLFAALAGAIWLHERLTLWGWAGCLLLFTALVLVETGPLLAGLKRWRSGVIIAGGGT